MKWNAGGGGGGGEFERAPVGSHLARCYALIDLGTQPHTFQNETKLSRDAQLSFELPYALMQGLYNKELKGKPFTAHMVVKQSLHEKAKLRKYLEGWRGKRFDADSIRAFVPQKLVGSCCRLSLVEGKNGWINIDSIAPATKEEQERMPPPVNPPLFFSLEREAYSEAVFRQLKDKTQAKILLSPEWEALQEPEPEAPPPSSSKDHMSVDEMDEVPF